MKHLAKSALVAAALVGAAPAFAAGEGSAIDTILGNFDVSGISTFAVTAGAAVVGIALAIKGIAYAKRFVRMS